MNKIKFAVVGTGNMASVMMEAFSCHTEAEVVAVHSSNLQRAKKFANRYNIAKPCDDLDMILKDREISAIYIANSTEKHAETSIRCLEAGKPVLCEKPCAINFEEFTHLADVVKKSKTLFMEGIWTLSLPSYQRLFSLIEEKAFCAPSTLFASFGYPVSQESNPQLFKTSSGGVLLDRSVYLIALAIKIFGKVARLEGDVNVNEAGVDVDYNGIINHAYGEASHISASFSSLLPNNVFIACQNGAIEIPSPALGAEYIAYQSYQAPQQKKYDSLDEHMGFIHKLKKQSFVRKVKKILSGPKSEFLSYGPSPYLPQLVHFCDLLKRAETESPVVPLILSGQVIEAIAKIKETASGRP